MSSPQDIADRHDHGVRRSNEIAFDPAQVGLGDAGRVGEFLNREPEFLSPVPGELTKSRSWSSDNPCHGCYAPGR
jgi:hypothetical protein